MELPVQPVLCDMLRIGSLPGTAIVLVLNSRLDIQAAANTKHPLLIYIQFVVVCQIVLDPAISFVRIFSMYLLHDFCDLLVFQLSAALFSAQPAVVGCS